MRCDVINYNDVLLIYRLWKILLFYVSRPETFGMSLACITKCDTNLIIIIDNRGLNARWCLTPFLLSLPTAAYLGQRARTCEELIAHLAGDDDAAAVVQSLLHCLVQRDSVQ